MSAQEKAKNGEQKRPEYMKLVEKGMTICNRCGYEYNYREMDVPEDATMYYVPHCPNCHAKMTSTTTDKIWLNIIGSSLNKDDENYQVRREKLHAHARLYHGKLINYSVSELIRRAKWFDRQATKGSAYGPRQYRDVAFNIRKQAREKQ
jgi:hypothetical protein